MANTMKNKFEKFLQELFSRGVRGRGGISVKNTRLGDNIIFNRN